MQPSESMFRRVDWFDGLALEASHLEQIDNRLDALVGLIATLTLGQGGILVREDDLQARGQLVAVEGYRPVTGGFDIDFRLLDHFLAISPDGYFHQFGSRDSGSNSPDASLCFSAYIAGDVAFNKEGIRLCASVERVKNPSLALEPSPSGALPLKQNRPRGILLTDEEYLNGGFGKYSRQVPIASILLSGDTPTVHNDFLPPVLRLNLIEAFDREVLSKIVSEFDALSGVVRSSVDKGGEAFVKSAVDADFMIRRSDYESLQVILLMWEGRIRNLRKLSPSQLMVDFSQPVASWWLKHQRRHFPALDAARGSTPVGAATQAAEYLLRMGQAHLNLGTRALLKSTLQLLEAVTEVVVKYA